MNHLLQQINAAKQAAYAKGVNDGRVVQKAVDYIALNEAYQFGGERLAKVESEAAKIYDEVRGDTETGARHLVERLNQIKGVKCGKEIP